MEKIIGDYTWNESNLLGQGAFGIVYKGSKISSGEQVAIKVLSMDNLRTFEDRMMIKKEIDLLRKLKGEHITKLNDVKAEGRTAFVIMEYCPDGDLQKYINENIQFLDEKDAIRILKQIMKGFKEIIDIGYIHRDIKPANILRKGPIFKVADFGFATESDISGRLTMKEYVGSPMYMSPQILQEQPYSAKSDIWSIGIMFYQIIFGFTPWPARSKESYIHSILSSPLQFPFSKPISENSKDFIKKCLQIDEECRIGWDEIFNHKLLIEDIEEQAIDYPKYQFVDQAKVIIRKLQQLIQASDINVNQIFTNNNSNTKLNNKQFQNFITQIDQSITSQESDLIFFCVDLSGDGYVEIEEFKKVFYYYDFTDINKKALYLIRDLKAIIKDSKLNILEFFQKYDLDLGGTLDYNEFSQMIQQFAPAFKKEEIKMVYDYFDQNQDQKISFKEFHKIITYGLVNIGEPVDSLSEKCEKIISQIQQFFKDYKIDPTEIYQEFLIDENLMWNEKSFMNFISIFENMTSKQELNYFFNLFSETSVISLESFSNIVKL